MIGNWVIAGLFLAMCVLLMLFLQTLFIPALLLGAAALGYVVWQGAGLIRPGDSCCVFDARRLIRLLAALLLLTLIAEAVTTVIAG